MILERSTDESWLANAYLVADRPGGVGVLIDLNERLEPLLEAAERNRVAITHILLTHEHDDHVVGLESVRRRLGAEVVAHRLAGPAIAVVDRLVEDGERLEVGDMVIEVIHLGGHSAGQVAYLVDDTDCFTADALFRGTLGGQREPGQAAFEEVRTSVMERLLALDGDTALHPGHAEQTTVAHELEHNPFVRIWRGLDSASSEPCRVASAFGWEATLVLQAPDYAGGTEAWVRFPKGGDAIIGGSQVHPADGSQQRSAARGTQPSGPPDATVTLASSRIEAVIPVSNLETALAFYTTSLGLRLIEHVSEVEGRREARLAVAQGSLTIYESSAAGATSSTIAAFLVDDLDVVLTDLRSRGVAPLDYDLPHLRTEGGVATIGRTRVAWIADPDGNLLGVNTV